MAVAIIVAFILILLVVIYYPYDPNTPANP